MAARSMYEQAMGASFGRLPAAVQRFHRLAGQQVLHGWVQTDAPSTLLAKLLALCLGTPLKATQGAIRFELRAAPDGETWMRQFPAQTMTSSLRLDGHDIVERLGASRLTFALCESDGKLQMRLQGLRFIGIPCPGWLLPQIVAEETGEAEQLNFRVHASLPLVGTVASYRGHLDIAAQDQP